LGYGRRQLGAFPFQSAGSPWSLETTCSKELLGLNDWKVDFLLKQNQKAWRMPALQRKGRLTIVVASIV